MKGLAALLVVLNLASASGNAAERFAVDPRVFDCAPDAVTAADTLVLSKNSPELRELAVFRPGATTPHFLLVGTPPTEMKPILSPGQLGALREVRLRVAELTGLEWRVGAVQEPVFTVPGTYRFIVAEVLESEGGAYACEVEYQPRRRPADRSPGPAPLRVSALLGRAPMEHNRIDGDRVR